MGMLTLVKSDDGDWEGLYFDGCLCDENHSLNAPDVLEVVQQYICTETEVIVIDSEWLINESGLLPARLTEIPNEAKL